MSSLTWGQYLYIGGVFVAAIVLHRLRKRASLLRIPGPRSANWLLGNEWEIYNNVAGRVWNRWIDLYGPVVLYKNAFFNGYTVLLADPIAVKSLLSDGPDGYTWHKPPFNRQTNERLLGRGVIWAEGDDHRVQRRLLSPAFSPTSTRLVSDAFWETADNLKSVLQRQIDLDPARTARVNAADLMSRAALDVIGLAGFEHKFHAVLSASREAVSITDGLHQALGAPPGWRMFLTLNLAKSFPFIFNHAPLKAIQNQRASKASIDIVAYKVLADAKKSLLEKDGKSILSILLQESQKGGEKLSEKEIVDNFSTMITAGHETTGITLSLILYELSRNQPFQDLLRKELFAVGGGQLSFDDLQSGKATHLDAVIKEVLRVYPANIRIIRRAETDQVLPLSQPLPSAKERAGDTQLLIPANTDVVIPLAAINTLKSIWGPDAHLFKPERWLEKDGIPETVKVLPQGYERIFTFVSGPRACLGMRFALAEMRVLLSQILSSYIFTPIDDANIPLDIVSPAQIMIRAQDPTRGIYGVPLRVREVKN
ncbi:cytochrome P450 [Naematelia encephala]|uniref:Cytochrome P450 n=1 Tax=Naematelia encephala TaxID=71784 RepID=A0A1Y2B7V0_9TREE|nr:cytochrome P450 [Naematelia encephala]